jgi:Thiamine pyrophosphate enzyme, N-terminal TPP binding domain
MPLMAGRQAFLEILRAVGVEYIIGNPGTTKLPLMDVLLDHPDFKYILTLQEVVAMATNRKNKRHCALAPAALSPAPPPVPAPGPRLVRRTQCAAAAPPERHATRRSAGSRGLAGHGRR